MSVKKPCIALEFGSSSPDGELAAIAALPAGVLHDEGISRGPTPHVFFYGLDRDGRSVETIVAGPLFGGPLRPAIMATGDARATFLIAWEHKEDDSGRIDGARVRCSTR